MKLNRESSAPDRAQSLENHLHVKIPRIKALSFAGEPVHCENLVGATTIPLGVAGPLLINGNALKGGHFIPLATTEGALVASVSRGCKAVSAAGGVSVHTENSGITRGPVFAVAGIREGAKLRQWLDEHFAELAGTAGETSPHLALMKLETKQAGLNVFVRFHFETGEAMGMNMATIASAALARKIEEDTGARCISVSGNYCIDKKPAFLNFIDGRGRQAWAEAVITRDTVRETLKTTPEKIAEVWLAKCMTGSALAGSLGFNAHYANIVAAIFAATGQDLAHVVEGSLGMTTAKVLEGGSLYFSVYLPALIVGTVGGGTKLEIKKEALSIAQVSNSEGLAEAAAAAVLAGELSLIASLAENTLATAHRALGR